MKVVDHEPRTWFLLEETGALFLDGNYNHSFIGYDWMIQLNADEMAWYRQRGREFISWLAADIQNSVPLLQMSNSRYNARRVPSALYDKASSAIEAWKQTTRDTSSVP
jgi:hypothetical protein